jgi:hypothetical protein
MLPTYPLFRGLVCERLLFFYADPGALTCIGAVSWKKEKIKRAHVTMTSVQKCNLVLIVAFTGGRQQVDGQLVGVGR